MLQRVKNFFESYYAIRPSEFRLVQLAFISLVVISIFVTVISVVGDALFLANISQYSLPRLLPLVYISGGVLTIIVTWVYAFLVEKFSRIRFTIGTQIVLGVSLLGFRLLFTLTHSQWLYFSLFVWVLTCLTIALTSFYSFLGDYFDIYSARRVYGYISIGIAVGSLLGGALTVYLLRYVSVENLLYFCIFLVILVAYLLYFISRNAVPRLYTVLRKKEQNVSLLKSIVTNNYILIIFSSVTIAAFFTVVANFQMMSVLRQALPAEKLANFFANFYGYIGLVELIIQVFLSSWLLRRFGIFKNLLALPLLLVMASFVAIYHLFYPSIVFFVAIVFINLTFIESIYQNRYELLFLVLPWRLRIYSQSLANGILGPVGKILSGLTLVIFAIINLPEVYYIVLLIIISVVWLVSTVILSWQYKKVLANAITHQTFYSDEFAANVTMLEKVLSSQDYESMLIRLLHTSDSRVQLLILDLLSKDTLRRLKPEIMALTSSQDVQVVAQTLQILGTYGDSNDIPVIHKFLDDLRSDIQESAMIAYCRILKANALPVMSTYLNSPISTAQITSTAACFVFGGEEGVKLAKQTMQALLQTNRVDAAKVIALIDNDNFTPDLNQLLLDPDESVRREAIIACQQFPQAIFIPNLIHNYSAYKTLQPLVRVTLFSMPATCRHEIIRLFASENYPEAVRRILLRVLGKMGGRNH